MVLPADIVAKLNECAKTDFISARDCWFSGLKWSTTIVAAGLVLELPELWYELADIARNRFDRFRYRVVFLESRIQLAKFIAFIGWFLIVGGVVGERVAEVRVNDLDASIQGCNAAKLTEAILEAGDAKTSAKTAHDEADAVGIAVGKAQQKANDVAERTKQLRQETSAISATLAEESNLLEQEQQTRKELEKSLAPRRLWNITYTDGTTNLDKLKEFTGTEVILEAIPDSESEAAAGEIAFILGEAGWNIVKRGITTEPVGNGVSVEQYMARHSIPEQNATEREAEWRSEHIASTFSCFLRASGWVASGEFSNRGELPPNHIRVRVGYKPNPYFDTSVFDANTKERMKKIERKANKECGNPNADKTPKNRVRAVGGSYQFQSKP